MPKSWTGSRYTGNSCTSSRLRNVASEVTGPGVTTWRLVRMRPRSASTTKPVACAEEFHSVSKARVWSISMATTLSATRASVPRQAALSPSDCRRAACADGDWATTCGGEDMESRRSPSNANRRRVMQVPLCCLDRDRTWDGSTPEHQHPHHGEQQQRHEYRRGTDVLGETRQFVPLEADAIDRRLDGAVDELHDEHDEHRRDQQHAFDAVLA